MKNQCVVLITGASSGIGMAIGSYLSAHGHHVIGTSRTPAKYPNHPFSLVSMNLLDDASIQSVIQDIVAHHQRIDVLINNAGMGMAGPLAELDMAPIDTIIDTNLK